MLTAKLTLGLTAIVATADAGHLQKVWASNADPGLGVFGLSFSPDGKRIAVVIGRSWQEESILILSVDNSQKNRSLAVNPKYSEWDPGPRNGFSWSASGGQLILAGTIVDAENGHTCTLPESARSPGPRVVGPTVAVKLSSRIALIDLDCHERTAWESDARTRLIDTSQERRLVYTQWMSFDGTRGGGTIQALDERTVVRTISSARDAAFADSGKALCAVRGKDWSPTVESIDVDTGEKLGFSKGWTHLSVRAAANAPRLVLTDYGRIIDFIDWRWALGPLKRRVVWDYSLGKELASWSPKFQNVISGITPLNPVPRLEPYRFAISPDGNYIVEGGASVITLYKIEP